MTSDGSASATSSSTSTTADQTTTVPTSSSPTTPIDEVDTGDVEGFDVSRIRIGDEDLVVALADEPAERARGLMEVFDLGELDGMLFSWGGSQVTTGFYMKNTLIPLTIAFYADDGSYVDSFEMEPCSTEECPTYRASGSFAYAIEFPAVRDVSAGDRLFLQP